MNLKSKICLYLVTEGGSTNNVCLELRISSEWALANCKLYGPTITNEVQIQVLRFSLILLPISIHVTTKINTPKNQNHVPFFPHQQYIANTASCFPHKLTNIMDSSSKNKTLKNQMIYLISFLYKKRFKNIWKILYI